jgi:hypothetical protein
MPKDITTQEAYEEDTEHYSLSSSSTFDKRSHDGGVLNDAEQDFFEMDLRYPSDGDQSPAIPANGQGTVPQTNDSYNNDTDADGDIDPDFGHAIDDPFIVASPTDIRENGKYHSVDQLKR